MSDAAVVAQLQADAPLETFDHVVFAPTALKDKVALVTGGGSGIGFRIAEMYLRHGCKGVVICSRKKERIEAAAGRLDALAAGKCVGLVADVREEKTVDAAVGECLRRFGRLDILVNCAAGNFLCGAGALSPRAFRTVLDIDTVGTFIASRSAWRQWMCDHGGVIVNITATLHYTGDPLQVHAGSAKAAIDAMTKHLAVEWGRDGVRVVAVAPGPIAGTEGMRRLGGFLPPAKEARFMATVPAGRWGTRADIAMACVYLASPAASFVTGEVLVVDGGAWLCGGQHQLAAIMGDDDQGGAAAAGVKVRSKL